MKITAPNGFVFFMTAASLAISGTVGAATTKNAPPPPMPVASPPPPAISIPPAYETPDDSARILRAMQEIVTFDVEVTGGSERLWLGVMRVNNQQSGEYQASHRQARPACPGTDPAMRNSGGGQQNQLNVAIQRRSWNREIDSFNARVNWVHPRQECEGGGGQTTVAFDQGFTLKPGETTRIDGEGGLAVKISRRR